MYEKERELISFSTQNWLSEEVFKPQWFLMIGILIIVYTVWLKLVDKRRGTELLLIGSLMAVANSISFIILSNQLGLVSYNIRIFPVISVIYASSVTISPIIAMLVTQYALTWKGFLVGDAIGDAALCFVIFPIYTFTGILNFHNGWNVFYQFLVLYGISIGTRIVFLWITDTQRRRTSHAA